MLTLLRVGLDCLFLVPGRTGGTEIYARELVAALANRSEIVALAAFVGSEAAELELPESVERVVLPVRASRRSALVLGQQVLLPTASARLQIDVLHSLANTAPARTSCRRVVTVHDLLHRTVPTSHTPSRRAGICALVHLAARTSHRIIVPTATVAAEVERYLRRPAKSISVIPHAARVRAVEAGADPAELRRRFDLPSDRRLVLALSAKHPHKNLATLLRALAQLDDRPIAVLVGRPTPHERELRALAGQLGIRDDVRFPGWLDHRDVAALLRVATVLVDAAFAEGFGLPVVEAMAAGVPVACGRGGSLREFEGAVAEFDPASPASMATVLRNLLHDVELRASLVAAGRARVAALSWQRVARETVAAYAMTLGDGP